MATNRTAVLAAATGFVATISGCNALLGIDDPALGSGGNGHAGGGAGGNNASGTSGVSAAGSGAAGNGGTWGGGGALPSGATAGHAPQAGTAGSWNPGGGPNGGSTNVAGKGGAGAPTTLGGAAGSAGAPASGATQVGGANAQGGNAGGGYWAGAGSGGKSSGGSGGSGCSGSEVSCAAQCVNLETNANHCGACGHACGAGSSCVGWACQPVRLVSGINAPTEFAVGGGYLYFKATVGTDPTVGRCPETGCSSAPTYMVSGFTSVGPVAADATRLFFAGVRTAGTAYDVVFTCPAAGCPTTPTRLSSVTTYSTIAGVTIDDQRVVWWGDANQYAYVEYCPVSGCDGSDETRVYWVRSDTVSALATGNGDIYISGTFGGTNGIYRCAAGDCTAARTAVLEGVRAVQLDYDQGELFWLTSDGRSIYRCTATSCTSSSVYSYESGIERIAVDASGVYFADSSGQVRACARSGCAGLPKLLGTISGHVLKLVLAGDFVYWLTDDSAAAVLERVAKPVF